MKQQAAVNVFASAGTAVDNALTTHVGRRDPCGELPLPSSLARAANRYRTKNRPRHPDTLDFEVDSHHIPDGFLRIDISSAHARHLAAARVRCTALSPQQSKNLVCMHSNFSIFAVIQHKLLITRSD